MDMKHKNDKPQKLNLIAGYQIVFYISIYHIITKKKGLNIFFKKISKIMKIFYF